MSSRSCDRPGGSGRVEDLARGEWAMGCVVAGAQATRCDRRGLRTPLQALGILAACFFSNRFFRRWTEHGFFFFTRFAFWGVIIGFSRDAFSMRVSFFSSTKFRYVWTA